MFGKLRQETIEIAGRIDATSIGGSVGANTQQLLPIAGCGDGHRLSLRVALVAKHLSQYGSPHGLDHDEPCWTGAHLEARTRPEWSQPRSAAARSDDRVC